MVPCTHGDDQSGRETLLSSYALLSSWGIRKGKWDRDVIMFLTEGFKLGFAEGIISMTTVSCKMFAYLMV